MSVRAHEAEEVDVGRYWAAILARWWLPVLGLAAGLLVGYVISLGGKQVYRAVATVYLGQPYGGLGGNAALQGPGTNPSTVKQIARSDAAIERAAARAGIDPDDLRGHVTTKPVAGNITRLNQTPLVEIVVTGSARRKVRIAANALANVVVENTSGYTHAKITALQEQIANADDRLSTLDRAIRTADGTTAIVLALQRGEVQEDRLNAVQLLAQAREIEAPRVLTQASATKTTARSRRNTMVVAGLLGLLLGLVAALVWEPVAARVQRA